MSNEDVTIVICTKNAGEKIEKIISSAIEQEPGEIIIVDANSTDGTREIAEKYNVRILCDPGKGLALARQIGLNEVQTKFVLYLGDDNLLSQGSLTKIKDYLISHKWVGCAFTTRLFYINSYWDYCTDIRWRNRFYEGERDIIGTPYLFYTDVLKEVGYDKDMAYSDDTDFEFRIKELHPDYKFGYSNIDCYDFGHSSYSDVKGRYLMYGVSDYQFWSKYSKEWGFARKIRSILHPFVAEFVDPLSHGGSPAEIAKTMPYYIFAAALRYMGWLEGSRKAR